MTASLCAGRGARGRCSSRVGCPTGAAGVGGVEGAQRCPPTPAFAQQGQSLREGKILLRNKKEASLQASSRLSTARVSRGRKPPAVRWGDACRLCSAAWGPGGTGERRAGTNHHPQW